MKENEHYEKRLDNAIFTGVLGLVVILLGLPSVGILKTDSPAFRFFLSVVSLFTIIAIVRMYGIILKWEKVINLSTTILRAAILPISIYLSTIVFFIQYFPNNIIVFYLSMFIGSLLMFATIGQVIEIEGWRKPKKLTEKDIERMIKIAKLKRRIKNSIFNIIYHSTDWLNLI